MPKTKNNCKKQADPLFYVDKSIKMRKKIMGQKEIKRHLEQFKNAINHD